MGDEQLSTILRAAVSLELYLNSNFYADHPFLTQKIYENVERNERGIFSCAFPHDVSDGFTDDYGMSKVQCVHHEALSNLKERRFGCLMDILALSTVLEANIRTVYPHNVQDIHTSMNNGLIHPCNQTVSQVKPLVIMWSRSGDLKKLGRSLFEPNHFVPVLCTAPVLSTAPVVPANANIDIPPPPKKLMKLDGKGVTGKSISII